MAGSSPVCNPFDQDPRHLLRGPLQIGRGTLIQCSQCGCIGLRLGNFHLRLDGTSVETLLAALPSLEEISNHLSPADYDQASDGSRPDSPERFHIAIRGCCLGLFLNAQEVQELRSLLQYGRKWIGGLAPQPAESFPPFSPWIH